MLLILTGTQCAPILTLPLYYVFVFDENLTQIIEGPTHIKGNMLDLIFTNNNDII